MAHFSSLYPSRLPNLQPIFSHLHSPHCKPKHLPMPQKNPSFSTTLDNLQRILPNSRPSLPPSNIQRRRRLVVVVVVVVAPVLVSKNLLLHASPGLHHQNVYRHGQDSALRLCLDAPKVDCDPAGPPGHGAAVGHRARQACPKR